MQKFIGTMISRNFLLDLFSRNFSCRFIFYDVNPGEGFNLRRDVFMRVGIMVKKLNDQSTKYSYTLVLPPWGPLYHWQTRELGIQSRIPWKDFFDVDSISRYVPVIDLEDFLGKSLSGLPTFNLGK